MKRERSVIAGNVLFVLFTAGALQAGSQVQAQYDAESGRVEISDAGQPILRYNHGTVPVPDGFLEKLNKKKQRYARARSGYIHPLYGPHGEELTADWNRDHPHHRGIYWAWPEVQYNSEMGDLHALQRVWARPRGEVAISQGSNWVELVANSIWMWEDDVPIVREKATIRAWRAEEAGRYIDLALEFEALEDGVTLARRRTQNYGGLNIRLAPIANMKLIHHADPDDADPRMAWQAALGTWRDAAKPATKTTTALCHAVGKILSLAGGRTVHPSPGSYRQTSSSDPAGPEPPMTIIAPSYSTASW